MAYEEYECHITIAEPAEVKYFEHLAKEHKWKTSVIVGDPLLGKKGFFYFTCHSSSYDMIYSKMEKLAFQLGKLVLRKKIERIMYDTKRHLVDGVA